MNTWPNRGACGGPCGGLKEKKTNPRTVRPCRSDSSQLASLKTGAVHSCGCLRLCTSAYAMNDLILYTTEDGRSQITLRAKGEPVWLTQREMAQLFDVSTDNVGLHLKNIFEDGELSREATAEESSVVQIEGTREVRRPVTLYNLDAILAVGYRVRSPRGVQFRRWASTGLKEYLIKGFVMDDERLKNPDGRPDYFDEMLARIRDIRAPEKRFYQKVRDLFALSSDYDKTEQATQVLISNELQRPDAGRRKSC